MDEKILQDITSMLRHIEAKIDASKLTQFRGPVADPAPEWPWQYYPPDLPYRKYISEIIPSLRGPVADPAPEYLLDKARLAQIKIQKLDAQIVQLEKQIESLKLEQGLLREEYGMKG